MKLKIPSFLCKPTAATSFSNPIGNKVFKAAAEALVSIGQLFQAKNLPSRLFKLCFIAIPLMASPLPISAAKPWPVFGNRYPSQKLTFETRRISSILGYQEGKELIARNCPSLIIQGKPLIEDAAQGPGGVLIQPETIGQALDDQILSANSPFTAEEAKGIIAHEIAHKILKHRPVSTPQAAQKQEFEADAYVAKKSPSLGEGLLNYLKRTGYGHEKKAIHPFDTHPTNKQRIAKIQQTLCKYHKKHCKK